MKVFKAQTSTCEWPPTGRPVCHRRAALLFVADQVSAGEVFIGLQASADPVRHQLPGGWGSRRSSSRWTSTLSGSKETRSSTRPTPV